MPKACVRSSLILPGRVVLGVCVLQCREPYARDTASSEARLHEIGFRESGISPREVIGTPRHLRILLR